MIALNNKWRIEEDILSAFLHDTETQKIFKSYIGSIPSKTSVVLAYPEKESFSLETTKAIQKLKSYKKLDYNWDSYGAARPSIKAIEQAIRFVKALDEWLQPVFFTAPGPNGEILVELKNGIKSIEIFFKDDNLNEFVLFVNEDEEDEGEFTSEKITQLLDWLNN